VWQCGVAVALEAAVDVSLQLLLGAQIVRRDSISETNTSHVNI